MEGFNNAECELDILMGKDASTQDNSDSDTSLDDFDIQPCTANVSVKQEQPEEADEEFDNEEESVSRSTEAIEHIEDLVVSFLTQLSRPPFSSRHYGKSEDKQDLADDGETSPVKPKPNKIELQLADRRKAAIDGSARVRSICYPRNSKGASAKPFAQLFRVLDLTQEALIDGLPVTKRDMFYKDVPLFKTQRVVDYLVDDLAATFQLERSDLNIRATSKGLICGAGLVVHLLTGETMHANDTEGALIPVGEDIQSFSLVHEVSWVLVVEKDAIFQTLCRLRLANHSSLPGRGLIITGKGYPDMATRHLVKTLSDSLPSSIPIMALVDGDAYGIDILSVYKHGSKSLQHENAKLAAERVEWLGVWASELELLGIDRDALIPITKHDEKKALSMLRRPQSTMPPKWRKELMHMLHTRRKAEIEVLSTAKSAPLQDVNNIPRSCWNQDQYPWRMITTDGQTKLTTMDDHDMLMDETSYSTPASLAPSSSFPPPFSSPSNTALSSSTSASSAHSSSTPAPHGPPLLRYLVSKITGFVFSAQGRAAS